ncbi:MAG: sigma-70 family RNA polymerase sigma factor [Myxococcales bacterium]|nr:sigma-70 family RNA polymerase sigma factor [Myxococcales bacterium]
MNVAAGELTAAGSAEMLDVERVYGEHADFVWRSLQRLGAPEAELEDLLQEVFVVVHRRRKSFDGRSKLTTWLFGISLRVVRGHRRRARFRRERPTPAPPEAVEGRTPERAMQALQARQKLTAVLDGIEPERRATFVMFELEGLSTRAIAELMGVPIGTVHSRLHLARRDFARALVRFEQKCERVAKARRAR